MFNWLYDWWLIDWFCGLRPLARLCIALVPIIVSTILYFAHIATPWGHITGWGLGVVLLVLAIPRHEEKNKWGDW